MKHMPGLDTLRALAIMLVMPRHAWEILHWSSLKIFFGRCGWAGVDLFFVLSGFLIGSQLLEGLKRDGHIKFGRFYLKRAFRILPSYLVVLLLYLIWPAFRETPKMQPLWHFLTFTMNFGVERGKWAFSHAWSLCIEEHFYLFFPIIASLCVPPRRFFNPKILIVSLLFFGLALRFYLWTIKAPFYPSIYRPTYTHLDGLIIGVSLAMIKIYRGEFWNEILSHPWKLFGVGFTFTSFGIYILNAFTVDAGDFIGPTFTFLFISIGFGLWVAAAQAPKFWLAEMRIPGIPLIAALAYSLYLTHKQMIQIAVRIVGGKAENAFLIIATSIALVSIAALLLHYLIEKPFLRMRDRLLKKS